MGSRWFVLPLALLVFLSAGCISATAPPGITVTNLDTGDIPAVNVGNFDIYTDSFQVENPTNLTYEQVDVQIVMRPSAVYCHGVTKTFSYPEMLPYAKKIEQISIAEFADLGCQYNYTYQVSGTAIP